eukprot:694980-Prorocentrum_minimum.AAC.1
MYFGGRMRGGVAPLGPLGRMRRGIGPAGAFEGVVRHVDPHAQLLRLVGALAVLLDDQDDRHILLDYTTSFLRVLLCQ